MTFPASNDGAPVRASVVIPTRDRRDCLRQAIRSAQAQTVKPEIIVMDDGSTDGTAEMMRAEFADVHYEQADGGKGPCVLRNQGAALAAGPILIFIDDDAFFPSPHTIEQTLADFGASESIGAVAIPFINVQQSDRVEQQSPDRSHVFATSAFVGAAHALRRDPFLDLGGLAEDFYYMGEEGDFCLRLLSQGLIVALGNADPIHHLESPLRSSDRADYFGYRNLLLFAWRLVPEPLLIPTMANAVFSGTVNAVCRRRPRNIAAGLIAGLVWPFGHGGARRPVDRETYRVFRRLRVAPIPLEELAAFLAARRRH